MPIRLKSNKYKIALILMEKIQFFLIFITVVEIKKRNILRKFLHHFSGHSFIWPWAQLFLRQFKWQTHVLFNNLHHLVNLFPITLSNALHGTNHR